MDGAKSSGLKKVVSGSSATGILDNLGGDNYNTPYLDLDVDDDDYDYDSEVFDDFNESGIELGAVEIENNDDKMSFCDLGIVWGEVDDADGDEDWCLVGNNVIV